MDCKTFEIRDRSTMIPVLAVRLSPGCEQDRYLLSRAGYGATMEEQGDYVLVARIGGGQDGIDCRYDPRSWKELGLARTMRVAHQYLVDSLTTLSPAARSWVMRLGYGPRIDDLEWMQKAATPLWDSLPSGAVLDVEYLLGEAATSKRSEATEGW